ncbi:hypothetical protein [Sulfuricurvum sp.]|uniref:hypothetical protein n=1 Tax=Sulfuricurvum sp. TaxID=2025608 RepID=UPI0026338750|nr:hypothetical protein [Sulfuricurvum sp.]MDD2780879.1 hypothetical protein [Sulfuricurvum sp.]
MSIYKSIASVSLLLLLAGCSSTPTPALPEFKATKLDKSSVSNLKENEVKHLFYLTFNDHVRANGGSQYLKSAQSSPFLAVSGSNSSIVDARDTYNYSYTYGYYYDHPTMNITEVQQGTCLSKSFYPTSGKTRITENNCKDFTSLYRAPNAFEIQVESARNFVKNTFPVLLNNYNANKPQADQCRLKRSQETIALIDKTGLLNKNFLKTLQPVITTEALMPASKIAQIPSENFTCNALKDTVIVDVPNANKKYSFIYDKTLPLKTEYASLPKNLTITDIRYNFLNGYETEDKILNVSFDHKTGMTSYWEVAFTNKSNEFIEIQASDFTYGGKKILYVASSKYPLSVPPKSTKNIVLEGYAHPQTVKTMNDTYQIMVAVKYKKGSKEQTILKNETIKMEPLR